jgi:hypothetical protein
LQRRRPTKLLGRGGGRTINRPARRSDEQAGQAKSHQEETQLGFHAKIQVLAERLKLISIIMFKAAAAGYSI